jgi:hypothetical protein
MDSADPIPGSGPADARARLAARYPERRRGNVWWWVALGLLVVGVVGFFIWTRTEPTARAEVLAYEALTASQLQADILIQKPADAAAVCTIVAIDRSASVVGSTVARAGPGGADVSVRVVIETIQPASVAQVADCALA